MRVAGDDPSRDVDSKRIAHVENRLVRDPIGSDEIGGPGIVPYIVDDNVLRGSDRPGIRVIGLVLVRVGVRIGHDARDVHVGPADLGYQAAPEVLGGHYIDDFIGNACVQRGWKRGRGPAR